MNTLFDIMVLLCIIAVSCNKIVAEEVDDVKKEVIVAPIELTKAEVEMSHTINDFAIDIYRQAYKESSSSDLLLSPLSIAIDLSMPSTMNEEFAVLTNTLIFLLVKHHRGRSRNGLAQILKMLLGCPYQIWELAVFISVAALNNLRKKQLIVIMLK